MYSIVGHIMPGYDRDEEQEDIVATFDTQQDAIDYIKWAKLASYGPYSDPSFRVKSLLCLYDSAHVEAYIPAIPIHNPPIIK